MVAAHSNADVFQAYHITITDNSKQQFKVVSGSRDCTQLPSKPHSRRSIHILGVSRQDMTLSGEYLKIFAHVVKRETSHQLKMGEQLGIGWDHFMSTLL